MNYRFIALDMDGTLLDASHRIHDATVRTLDECRDKGAQVMLVTGRHHTAVLPYYRQLSLELPVICCNGTYAYDFGEQRASFSRPLTREQASGVLHKIREHDVHAIMYVDDAMMYEKRNPHLDSLLAWADAQPAEVRPNISGVDAFEPCLDAASTVWKFCVSHPDAQTIDATVADIEASLGLSCERSATNRYDVAQTGNSKGGLLAKWLELHGIDRHLLIAFGDNHNDISMLKIAGLGVAMGNADATVKSCAGMVIGGNESEAIAQTLRRYVLEVPCETC